MKRTFSREKLCTDVIQHLNCDDDMIERTITGLLSEEFPPSTAYRFNYIGDDVIEVNIDLAQE